MLLPLTLPKMAISKVLSEEKLCILLSLLEEDEPRQQYTKKCEGETAHNETPARPGVEVTF